MEGFNWPSTHPFSFALTASNEKLVGKPGFEARPQYQMDGLRMMYSILQYQMDGLRMMYSILRYQMDGLIFHPSVPDGWTHIPSFSTRWMGSYSILRYQMDGLIFHPSVPDGWTQDDVFHPSVPDGWTHIPSFGTRWMDSG